MSLATERRTYVSMLRRFIGGGNPPETLTFGNQMEPACPDTEGVIRIGGVDSSFPPEPQELKIRIIGSRDIRTGEILPCHQDVHGTYIELRPLESGQEVTIE